MKKNGNRARGGRENKAISLATSLNDIDLYGTRGGRDGDGFTFRI